MKKRFSLNKIIVFDLETTGLPDKAEIIEIGAIKYQKKGKKYKVLKMFSERIKPTYDYWSLEAERTHNIKKSYLKKCRTIDKVLPDFLEFLSKDYIVVGHRLAFDCTFIRKFCEILNLETPINTVLDTYTIAKNVLEINKYFAKLNFVKSYEFHLSDLIKYFNVTCTLSNAHRAYIDAMMTAEIFFKMKEGYSLKQLLPDTFDKIKFILQKR